jgi:hypothetical protein
VLPKAPKAGELRINGTDSRAELLALAADPAQVARLPLDRIPALRAAIRALHRDLGAVEEALDARWQADDGVCFGAAEIAKRLGCSIDLVRERGEEWSIAKVLSRDERGRPTRVTYPKPLFDAFLHSRDPL